jgi:Ala-tRNA(Pro) deacylase
MIDRAGLMLFFEQNSITQVTRDHEPVFHAIDGEAIKALVPGAHAKNLLLKDAKNQVWLVSARDDTVIDLKRLPKAIGSARLSFASPKLMGNLLGVTPGSVTPFALINDTAHQVKFVLDAALAASPIVNFHPLINTASTSMTPAELGRFLALLNVKPLIVDFARLG